MYTGVAVAVPASVKTCKLLKELSIFRWEAAVRRLWRNGATWVHVVVVQQQPACKPSHSMDVCAPHGWAVNCCYCSA